MKQLIFIFIFAMLGSLVSARAQCCSKAVAELTESVSFGAEKETSGVKAYYFHATRRCATCQAVEAVTKEALKEYYGEKVTFQSINQDEDSKNPLIKKFRVSGQALLIVKGDKVVNLTNEAFLNARTNPDKLKAKIKSTIDLMQ